MSAGDLPYAAELAEPGPGDASAPASLEEALAGSGAGPAEAWQVDRVDYQGMTFGLDELDDLVRRGWLDRTDGVRRLGEPRFVEAATVDRLRKAFALRQKLDEKKMATSASRGVPLYCANHAGKKARLACPGCSRFFCAECCNESEIRQKPVQLCVECDRPMTAL
jgi:hypothetical protein